MEKITKLLTEAEAEAKRIADANVQSPTAQILRARVRSALEFCEHVQLDAPAAPAKN